MKIKSALIIALFISIGLFSNCQSPYEPPIGMVFKATNQNIGISPSTLVNHNVKQITVSQKDLKKGVATAFIYSIDQNGLCNSYEIKNNYFNHKQHFSSDTIRADFYLGNGTYYLKNHTVEGFERNISGNLISKMLIENDVEKGTQKNTKLLFSKNDEIISEEIEKTSEKYGTLLSRIYNKEQNLLDHQSFKFDDNGVLRTIKIEQKNGASESDKSLLTSEKEWRNFRSLSSKEKYLYGVSWLKNKLTEKEYQYKVTAENFTFSMFYMPSEIIYRFQKMGENFKLLARFNRFGDQYMHLNLDEQGDTLEYILLDSTYLFPVRHMVLNNGKKSELVIVKKTYPNGHPKEIQSIYPSGKVYQLTVIKEDDGLINHFRLHTSVKIIDLKFDNEKERFTKEVLTGSLEKGLSMKADLSKSLISIWDKEDNTFRTRSLNLYTPNLYTDYWDYANGEAKVFSFEKEGHFLQKHFKYYQNDWYPVFEELNGSNGLVHWARIKPKIESSLKNDEKMKVDANYWDTMAYCLYNQQGELVKKRSWQTESNFLEQNYMYNENSELIREVWTRTDGDEGSVIKEITKTIIIHENEKWIISKESVYSGTAISTLIIDTTKFDKAQRIKCHAMYKTVYRDNETYKSAEKETYNYVVEYVDEGESYYLNSKSFRSVADNPFKQLSYRFVWHTFSDSGKLLETTKGYVNDNKEEIVTDKTVFKYDPDNSLLQGIDIYSENKVIKKIDIEYD